MNSANPVRARIPLEMWRFSYALRSAVVCASVLLLAAGCLARAQTITLPALLSEMTDRDALARLPQPSYQCLQASSYNRASTNRNQPNQDTTGWFADSDGLGFMRAEQIHGQTEWVIMEHQGPGCLTTLWTPFFYYGFADRKGPNIRIYLDGETSPVLDESLIELVAGKGCWPLRWRRDGRRRKRRSQASFLFFKSASTR
jgi:hypothetical protein